jgi:hypothetical protein
MMWFLVMLPALTFAQVKPDTFVIQINDRSMKVLCPEKKRDIFSIIVENHSLSDQVAKFTVGKRLLKFVSVKSGKSETVEIENKTGSALFFVPVSPAFQDVELIFGKKAYEVPSKE